MKSKILIVITIFLSLFLIGCEDNNKPVRLSNKFYNDGVFIDVNKKNLDNLKDDTYVLYVHNNFCNFTVPCDETFLVFMNKYKIDFLSISIDEYNGTEFSKKVKYAPSVLVIDKGKILAYLDANKDEDLDKYQDPDVFEQWIEKYIYIKE